MTSSSLSSSQSVGPSQVRSIGRQLPLPHVKSDFGHSKQRQNFDELSTYSPISYKKDRNKELTTQHA